ncbi:hypothetical protein LguiA_008913 [Lonicera macranthoides]
MGKETIRVAKENPRKVSPLKHIHMLKALALKWPFILSTSPNSHRLHPRRSTPPFISAHFSIYHHTLSCSLTISCLSLSPPMTCCFSPRPSISTIALLFPPSPVHLHCRRSILQASIRDDKGRAVQQVKLDMEKLQEEIKAQLLYYEAPQARICGGLQTTVPFDRFKIPNLSKLFSLELESVKMGYTNAQMECNAADERAKLLASEVIGLEEKALRLRSSELKLERQLESLQAEVSSSKAPWHSITCTPDIPSEFTTERSAILLSSSSFSSQTQIDPHMVVNSSQAKKIPVELFFLDERKKGQREGRGARESPEERDDDVAVHGQGDPPGRVPPGLPPPDQGRTRVVPESGMLPMLLRVHLNTSISTAKVERCCRIPADAFAGVNFPVAHGGRVANPVIRFFE